MAAKIKKFIRDHPDLAAVFGLVCASLLIRAWPVIAIRQSWEDAYFYLELARSLARGRFELLGSFHDKYLPGYPAAILALHSLALGGLDWFKSAQLVSGLASALAAGLAYVLALDVTSDRRAAWASGLMVMLNAHSVAYGGVPFAESLFGCQSLGVLVLVSRAPVLAGAVAGWAALTRHDGWLLGLVFLAQMAQKQDRRRPAAGLVVMAALAGSWWALAYHETGRWLFETYTREAAERAPVLGRSGITFLLLSLPVAGYVPTLLGLAGLPRLARERAGRPALIFLAAYCLLHAWWMFGVERYFVPLVPITCVAAGAGLLDLERLVKARAGNRLRFKLPSRLAWPVVPGIAFLAAAVHFAVLGQAIVEEEAVRTEGYVRAIHYLRDRPGRFSVMAYDAFMVGYHDGRHPVIPSGRYYQERWIEDLPGLYVNQGLRYLLWSNLYPADRDKPELFDPEPLEVTARVTVRDQERIITIRMAPEKVFHWTWRFPDPGSWLVRRQAVLDRRAVVWRLEAMPLGRAGSGD